MPYSVIQVLLKKNLFQAVREYTDGRKLLIADNDSHLITFIDLSVVESHETNTDGLLQKSINFVNNHGGWTDNYRFVGLESRGETFISASMDLMVILFLEKIIQFQKLKLIGLQLKLVSYSRNNFSLGQPALNPIKILESGHECN